jgi:hypothetical protein
MSFVLVPREVGPTTASVWAAAIDEEFDPTTVTLVSTAGSQPVRANWQVWPPTPQAPRITHQVIGLTGLQPGRSYRLELRVGGNTRAQAALTSLPDRLPTRDERPFTVFLGSCFWEAQDEEGRVGRAYASLPSGARPHVKILCGDQVYLDAPWVHYLLRTHDAAELEGRFFRSYERTWTQFGPGSGFRTLLEVGANYFTADDHEFWNNAPNRASVVRDTWFERGREDWLRAARSLYRMFQTSAQVVTFSVGPLGFLVADTRVDRSADETRFMRDEDLERVAQWVRALSGPGVLVLGQPVFVEPTGLTGHLTDWGLADYTQYGELVRILSSTRHSMVILTGDVHFGRVATCTLWSGPELIEVISSPMALVDEKARGRWRPAPGQFPAREVPGVVPSPIRTVSLRSSDNHFMTLEFSESGRAVDMVVRYWPVAGREGSPGGVKWHHTRIR